MKTRHFLKSTVTTSQDLSSAALSYTTSIGRNFKLEEVIIRFSQNVNETITITKDSKSGSNYDAVKRKRQLLDTRDFVYRPQGEENYRAGDEVKVECTNTYGVGVAYCEILTSEM